MPHSNVWASGVWRVKPGREAAFVEAWREFAAWSRDTFGGRRAWILRDRARPDELITLGPWPDDDAVARWRADPGFAERVGRLRDLVDGFEPRTLDELAAIEMDAD